MIEGEQERCMEAAYPLLTDFHDGWHAAVERYAAYPPEFTAEHDDTTAANCVRSHMWTEVVRRFEGRDGCKLIKLRGLNLLLHKDESVWRFKKVDGAGKHANYQTKQQEAFDDQLVLPDIPAEALRLTSGYQPDASGLGIERVIVARPYRRSMMWAAQINLDGDEPAWVDITPQRFTGTEGFETRERGE
jgi:hypothetical protein